MIAGVPRFNSRTPRRRRLLAGLVVLALLTAVRAVGAQPFRITYSRSSRDVEGSTHTVLVGTVFNTARRSALNVYLTAEALDAAGHVVATGVTYVSPGIDGNGAADFVVKVPRTLGTTSFRLMITSFRYGLGPQGP